MKKISYCFLFAFVFASCGSDNKKTSEAKTVFKYNELGSVTSLDPVAASTLENIWVDNQLFNGLVQVNDDLQIIPCIAHSWNISEDGLLYRFNLRSDVFFHDNKYFKDEKGRKVVASDFVYSFKRLLNPAISSALSLLSSVDENNPNSFEAPNDSTFIIHLKQPFAPFLNILAMKYFSVVPHEAVEGYGTDFGRNPVGTGPFKFKMWDDGVKMVLVKNETYFEKENNHSLPYLDAVSISFLKDKESSFLSFLQGDLDMVSGVDAINTDKVLNTDGTLKDEFKNKFVLQKQASLKTDYLGFLIDDSLEIVNKFPLKIKTVRQAINLGIDKNKMITYLRKSIGIPGNGGIIPPGLASFDTQKIKGYSYNPDKAKRLLAQAGFPSGKGLSEISLTTTEQYTELAEYIQAQLQDIGIKVKIDVLKGSILSEAIANNKIPFFRKSWVADYADEENFLSLFYSKNKSPKGFNYTHFNNRAFDELYDKALQEKDAALRTKYYQQMDQLILDNAVIVPLYYDEVVRLIQPNVVGLTTNAMNVLSLKKVNKK